MRITKRTSRENETDLVLDKDSNIKEVKALEYIVSTQNLEEYENIKHIIADAVLQEIEVYQSASNFDRLEWIHDRVFASRDFVIILITSDESKFDSLEGIIKKIVTKNKKFLH